MKFNFHSIMSIFLIPILMLVTIPTIGCTQSQTTIAINEINVILTQTTNIIAVADPGASWAPDLKAAVAALQTSEQSWQNGGSVVLVINALNSVVAITAVIPETNKYAPLIAVLVAGIEAVLAILPAPAGVKAGLTNVPNPYVVQGFLMQKQLQPRWYEFGSHTRAFKRVWNTTAHQNALVGATL